ncbi:hypothetical protein QFC19_008705 [Naganishia cerealis]|uniref:Uncharacterized protein n=1 Tax=Naganishia cerealis TaxID=610337 RepID=A0ACC2V1J6_9TREE|nr:hypothetical protein QFC19_008705 [Naganishia cerealis]
MEHELAAAEGFRYARPVGFQEVTPAIRTSAGEARALNVIGSALTKQPHNPGRSANFEGPRPLFPGISRASSGRVDRFRPFEVAGRRDDQDKNAEVEDSGRKSLKHTMEICDGAYADAPDRYAEQDQVAVKGSFAPQPPPRQPNAIESLTPAQLLRGLFAKTGLRQGEQGNTTVPNRTEPASQQGEEVYSQSLPLPSQGYVEDSYQTQVNGSLRLDNNVQAEEGMGIESVSNSADEMPAIKPHDQLEEVPVERPELHIKAAILGEHAATGDAGPARVDDSQTVEQHSRDGEQRTAVALPEAVAEYRSVAQVLSNLPPHRILMPVTAQSVDQGEGDHVDSLRKASVAQQQEATTNTAIQYQDTTSAREPRTNDDSVQSSDNVSVEVAGRGSASISTALRHVDNLIGISSSRSRSGRAVVSSKKLGGKSIADLINNQGNSHPQSRKQPHQQADMDMVILQTPAEAALQPDTRSSAATSKSVMSNRKSLVNTVSKAPAQPGMHKKKTHDSVKQKVTSAAKEQVVTGNARYQQRIHQSVSANGLSAGELKAARAAALPPQNRSPVTTVLRHVFTPSKYQRDKALDALLSRASTISPLAQANKVHPRASPVHARQARHDTAEPMIRSPGRPHQSVGAPHDGTIDEKAAMDLMFKAREREAEIARLRDKVDALNVQATVLETEKIELMAKNEEILSKNQQALKKQKEAVARARDIVVQSQVMQLEMCKPELDETKDALFSQVTAMHRYVDSLKSEVSNAREGEERVIIEQLKSEVKNLGNTTIQLQVQLDDEKSAKVSINESLLAAIGNVSKITEETQCLREEYIRARRVASEEYQTSLVAIENDRESVRQTLNSQIQSLAKTNEALLDKIHALQKELVKAETLATSLSDQLEDSKKNSLRLEESHKAEQKAREIAHRSLEGEHEKLKQEYERARLLGMNSEARCQELQTAIANSAEHFAIQQQAHDSELTNQKRAATLKEEALLAQLSSASEEYKRTREMLVKCESSLQLKSSEKEAINKQYLELETRFDRLKSDYEANVRDQQSALKTGSELITQVRQSAEKNVGLERKIAKLEKQLTIALEAQRKLEGDLASVEDSRKMCLSRSRKMEQEKASRQDMVEELKKIAEDGKAAHLEDVEKERARYERLKAVQDGFKDRYESGELTSLERDVLGMHVERIQTNHEEVLGKASRMVYVPESASLTACRIILYQIKSELAAAQTDASRWKKTAGRAASEKSQKIGGRSLIGSDFDDQSSSPHEPLRSTLPRKEHAPLIDFTNAAAAPVRAPSTPLTDIAPSEGRASFCPSRNVTHLEVDYLGPPRKRNDNLQNQTLSAFLAGANSTTKRVSFQELAGSPSDEMDNDEPDTLGRIAGEEDDMEEDIEESECLMETANTFTARVASSIENFTQPASKQVSVQAEKSVRVEVGATAVAPPKATQNKGSNATLGMIRSTRSQTQATTYTGASRKRVASILLGNDMESFSSTQEDAIYSRRGAVKKQRR